MSFSRLLLTIQAGVYLSTGAWSVVSRRTFERVTGPKTDYWLVRTVGLLAVVIGATLLAARSDPVSTATKILAIGSAIAFATIDVCYAIPRRISRIYLLDAVFEVALALALVVSWWLQ